VQRGAHNLSARQSSNVTNSNRSTISPEFDFRDARLSSRHDKGFRWLNIGDLSPRCREVEPLPILIHEYQSGEASQVGEV